MVGHVLPSWIAALQTLRREIESQALRDTDEGRDVERAIMIVREFETAPGDGPDGLPAEVREEDERGEPEVFPFRVDHKLGYIAPDGANRGNLRYKSAADLVIDMAAAPRYVERGIFTSWDERPQGILYCPKADIERKRAERLNNLFERGANCLKAVPGLQNRFSGDFSWNHSFGWLQVLLELGCNGSNSPLNIALKWIWCRDNDDGFARWCRENGKIFPVEMESREFFFRTARQDFRNRKAEIPQSLLIANPKTYCVTLEDVLHQSVYLIDWLCETDDPKAGDTTKTTQVSARTRESTSTPIQYAMNWREIVETLGMRNNTTSRTQVGGLNEFYNGPIIKGKRGQPPKVDKAKLIEWWNGLEDEFKRNESAAEAKAESVTQRYQHGRDATVFPEIQGHEKKRRRKRKDGNSAEDS